MNKIKKKKRQLQWLYLGQRADLLHKGKASLLSRGDLLTFLSDKDNVFLEANVKQLCQQPLQSSVSLSCATDTLRVQASTWGTSESPRIGKWRAGEQWNFYFMLCCKKLSRSTWTYCILTKQKYESVSKQANGYPDTQGLLGCLSRHGLHDFSVVFGVFSMVHFPLKMGLNTKFTFQGRVLNHSWCNASELWFGTMGSLPKRHNPQKYREKVIVH